jgi:hypothetical protein
MAPGQEAECIIIAAKEGGYSVEVADFNVESFLPAGVVLNQGDTVPVVFCLHA